MNPSDEWTKLWCESEKAYFQYQYKKLFKKLQREKYLNMPDGGCEKLDVSDNSINKERNDG